VRATDKFRAMDKLDSVSLNNVLAADNVSSDYWMIEFDKSIFNMVTAPSLEQAKKSAGWNTYLDKRERRIVNVIND
jgi:hypothetical protein